MRESARGSAGEGEREEEGARGEVRRKIQVGRISTSRKSE